MNDADIKIRARRVIDNAPNAVLATVDTSGFPQMRTMWTAYVDEDFNTFFVTGRGMPKCLQIDANPKVCVFWTQAEGGQLGPNYAMLKGNAVVTDDQELRNRFWNDELLQYFPGGKNDPNYVIIRIKPTELLLMDSMKYPLDRVEF